MGISESNWYNFETVEWKLFWYVNLLSENWQYHKYTRYNQIPKYPGGYPISRILLSQGGGLSSCIKKKKKNFEIPEKDAKLNNNHRSFIFTNYLQQV